ncbi:MAG: hypothetical protein QXO04_05055 [Nitrososphaerota archaeon]
MSRSSSNSGITEKKLEKGCIYEFGGEFGREFGREFGGEAREKAYIVFELSPILSQWN